MVCKSLWAIVCLFTCDSCSTSVWLARRLQPRIRFMTLLELKLWIREQVKPCSTWKDMLHTHKHTHTHTHTHTHVNMVKTTTSSKLTNTTLHSLIRVAELHSDGFKDQYGLRGREIQPCCYYYYLTYNNDICGHCLTPMPVAPARVSISSGWPSAQPQMMMTHPPGRRVGFLWPWGQGRLWWRCRMSCWQRWSKERQTSRDQAETHWRRVNVSESYLADDGLLDDNRCADEVGHEQFRFNCLEEDISWD